MIDLHCHILPGVDDGPAILAESLSMARQAVADGIHTIVATPHALGGAHPNPPDKVCDHVKKLQQHLKAESIQLKLLPGCEVHNCPDMAGKIADGQASFLNKQKKHILIEFPFKAVSNAFTSELLKLIKIGITPILAHPERNIMTYHNPEVLSDYIAKGCLVQMNSTSINGGFGPNILDNAKQLLHLRMVHIIASDAHSSGRRAPTLSLAVQFAGEALGDADEALKMVTDTPQQILDGEDVAVSR